MREVEWNRDAGRFVPYTGVGPGTPPAVDARTWWHSTREGAGTLNALPVSHFGDYESAQLRADVSGLRSTAPATMFEVSLPSTLAIWPDIYIENAGNKEMNAFEQLLLESSFDAAFYWNSKEAHGAWSLVVRRSAVGELPSVAAGVCLVRTEPWVPGPYFNDMSRATGHR